MAKFKIPKHPMHRCCSRHKDDRLSTNELIIIERKDISFPSTHVSPDVYGAIEVFISEETGDVSFYFILIRNDDQVFCPEFELPESFRMHVNAELRHAVYCKPMHEEFGVSGDIDALTEAHLNSIWLARCLAQKFRFTADISFNGHSVMTANGFAEVTMIRPWSGQETRFRAQYNLDSAGPDKYIGPHSPEGHLYFGKS